MEKSESSYGKGKKDFLDNYGVGICGVPPPQKRKEVHYLFWARETEELFVLFTSDLFFGRASTESSGKSSFSQIFAEDLGASLFDQKLIL